MNPEELSLIRDAVAPAVALMNEKKHAEALQAFEHLIGEHPAVHELKFGRAVALARLKRFAEALEVLQGLISNVPQHAKALKLIDELQSLAQPEVEKPATVPEPAAEAPKSDAPLDVPLQTAVESPVQPAAEVKTGPVDYRTLSEEEVQALINEAIVMLKRGEGHAALALLLEGKSQRRPARDLDYVRALCFVTLRRWADARQALIEELMFFPGNSEAKKLMAEVEREGAKELGLNLNGFPAEFVDLVKPLLSLVNAPLSRLFSLYRHAQRVCLLNISGNFVLCGVGSGVAAVLLASAVKRFSKKPRLVYAIDSFNGLPAAGEKDTYFGEAAYRRGWDTGANMASEELLLSLCQERGLDEIILVLKGELRETLQRELPILRPLALLSLDVWWYAETKAALEFLYDCLEESAVVQLNNFAYWSGVQEAFADFEKSRKLKITAHLIDSGSAWIERGAAHGR